MKIIESDKFRDMGESAAEMLRDFGDSMDNGQREFLTLKVKRAETHERIERVTGIRFAVANDVQRGVAAFVTVADGKAHITESTLDDAETALKAGHHENGHVKHLRQGVKDIELEENLEHEEFKTLNGYMKMCGFDLEDIDLLEGFNELGTAKEHGVNEKCGYNKKEVPAAAELEKLCMENTGRSLLAAFTAGDMDLFYELVKSICAIIKLREEFKMAA